MTRPLSYDVAVIGGGPAGMMAAGRAAELGARVVLLEKNAKLGKKLLITGGGRCNITNAELDVKKMVAKYGRKGKALFGAFARFGVEDTLHFFEQRKLPIKIEAEKRAFPVSQKAEDVWKVMVDYLKQGRVDVVYNAAVTGLASELGKITAVKLSKGEIRAKNYIVATGGKSRPETGSTGEGFLWMQSLGHTVEESDPALVPIKIKENWVKKLSGVSFSRAKLTVFQDKKKQDSGTGKILLTHFGLSGPLTLNMSKNVAELYKYAPVDLELDLYPDLDAMALDKKVLQHIGSSLNKKLKNNLGAIVPPKMISTILELAEIDPEKAGNALTKGERSKIVKLIKALPMSVAGFLGVEKAIVTSGGVSLKEIDFKTVQSKLYTNLYLAGDILNFDRPSGGFSLQICWTSGFLAGENSAKG
jgi:predicted Rossmann fold flavoprotein